MTYKEICDSKIIATIKNRASHLKEQANHACEHAEESIVSHPMASVGIAFAAGVGVATLLGMAGIFHKRS